MKLTYSLLLLFFCLCFGNAQELRCFTLDELREKVVLFDGDSEEECLDIVANIITYAERSYKFHEVKRTHNELIVRYIEKEPENPPLYIEFQFHHYMKGANLILEQPGVKVYEMEKITGRYLDLFPVWNHFFDPDADKVDISTQMSGKRLKAMSGNGGLRFSPSAKSRTFWYITIDRRGL